MRKFLLGVAVLALAGQANAATNLLTNGSFEDDLNGWSLSGSGTDQTGHVIAYNQSGPVGSNIGAWGEAVKTDSNPTLVGGSTKVNPAFDPVGDHAMYFLSNTGTETLTQTISITNTDSYTFGFDFFLPASGYGNLNDATFTAYVNGIQLATFTASDMQDETWYTFTGEQNLTAGDTFQFVFSADGDPAKDFIVDRVFLAHSSDVGNVPEAATWAMMVLGFGTIGATARRRRTSLTFA